MSATRQGNRAGRSVVRDYRSAALSGEFGMAMLRKHWPELADQILAELGVYSRGPRKGLPRGYVHWTKVIEGGWDYGAGGVLRPGTYDWRVLREANDRSESVSGLVAERHRVAAESVRMEGLRAMHEARAAQVARLGVTLSEDGRKLLRQALACRRRAHAERERGEADEFHEEMAMARQLLGQARAAEVRS